MNSAACVVLVATSLLVGAAGALGIEHVTGHVDPAGGWWCDRHRDRSCARNRDSCVYQAGSSDTGGMAMAFIAKLPPEQGTPPDRRDGPICEHRDVAYCFGGDGRGNSNLDTLDMAVCAATEKKCASADCAAVR